MTSATAWTHLESIPLDKPDAEGSTAYDSLSTAYDSLYTKRPEHASPQRPRFVGSADGKSLKLWFSGYRVLLWGDGNVFILTEGELSQRCERTPCH